MINKLDKKIVGQEISQKVQIIFLHDTIKMVKILRMTFIPISRVFFVDLFNDLSYALIFLAFFPYAIQTNVSLSPQLVTRTTILSFLKHFTSELIFVLGFVKI